MGAVKVDVSVHVEFKHLRRRSARPLNAVVVPDVLIPCPGADGHDQQFLGAEISIYRRHIQPCRLRDFRQVYRIDGSLGKDMEGCLYDLLLRPRLAQRVHFRIGTHVFLHDVKRLNHCDCTPAQG